MKILVTGAGGFVGTHLQTLLRSKGHQVVGAVWPPPLQLLEKNGLLKDNVTMDITNPDDIAQNLKQTRPAAIIHLAAQSMVGGAWENPGLTFQINTLGTINLINAIKDIVPKSILLTVGSSEEYGSTGKSGEPLTEDQPCYPQNPYATSKLATGLVAMQLAKKLDLKIFHVRPFNHFGPGQQEGYVVSDFASQIARAEQGIIPPVIKVGDLTAKRDFTDVRDVVEAYSMLIELEQLESGIYNICSGVARSAYEILDELLNNSSVSIRVEQDLDKFRSSDVPLFIGSAVKLKGAVNWRPKWEFGESIRETLDWWRVKVGSYPI